MRRSVAVSMCVSVIAFLGVAACARSSAVDRSAEVPAAVTMAIDTDGERAQILRGRHLTIEHACGGCHGGGANPADSGWLRGMRSPEEEFTIGTFKTRPRNLTPDNLTGLGRFSERQIFNALRFGLRPGETADVEITSTTPGVGNFPEAPKYLAPPMPWHSWRHMPDQDLRDIAAYLKRGVRPVRNLVLDSEGPPDFWAGEYTVEKIGTYPAPPFPTENEESVAIGSGGRDQILRGRQQVLEHACGDCHGGLNNPASSEWLQGFRHPEQEFPVGSFKLRPRNLTPDIETGVGRFTERQLFNALRFGLRPSDTPDVEITSTTPGVGNFPAKPSYLGPAMPWMIWRHMSDDDLRAIAAYLKRGLKPVRNQVLDSDRPPDSWASAYTVERIGPLPAVSFPTANERAP